MNVGYLKNVTFSGYSLADYNAAAIFTNILDTPARSVEVVSVPGRNGSLVYDNGRYDDVNREYTIVTDTLDHALEIIRAFRTVIGYARLTDGFEPDHYMMARLLTVASPKILSDSVRFSVTFVRKPQKFLKSGDTPVSITASSGTITNPTMYEALPIVRVWGTGTVSISGVVITINETSTYMDIDCDLQDARKGTTNFNSAITLTSGRFWRLVPGSNSIALGNSITEVRVTPKWWTL